MKRKVLITGAAGTIGSVVFKGLKEDDRYDVMGTDIQADEDQAIVQMDITDGKTTEGSRYYTSFCMDSR